MSRNLGDTSCRICNGTVVLCGEPYPITENNAGRYFEDYRGMIVADAVCESCDAKYMAWIKAPPLERWGHMAVDCEPGRFFDLSFRAAFNDEPAPEDLPTPEMLLRVHLEQCAAQQARLLHEIQAKLNEATTELAERLSRPPRWEAYRR
jgi:hypothetical protein